MYFISSSTHLSSTNQKHWLKASFLCVIKCHVELALYCPPTNHRTWVVNKVHSIFGYRLIFWCSNSMNKLYFDLQYNLTLPPDLHPLCRGTRQGPLYVELVLQNFIQWFIPHQTHIYVHRLKRIKRVRVMPSLSIYSPFVKI